MLNTKTSLFSLYVVVDQLQRVTQIERFVSFFLWVWKPNKSLRTQETVPDRCPLTYSGGPFWTPVVDSNSHESSMFISWPVFSGYLASTDRTLRLISKERITSRPTHFFLSFFGFETKKINPNKCLRMQEIVLDCCQPTNCGGPTGGSFGTYVICWVSRLKESKEESVAIVWPAGTGCTLTSEKRARRIGAEHRVTRWWSWGLRTKERKKERVNCKRTTQLILKKRE